MKDSISSTLDLIFVSMENWDDIWRRNQFVCAELARRFPACKILFVGLSRDISNRLRRLEFREMRSEATRPISGFPNITYTRPLKFAPNTLTAGRLLNEAMMRGHIRREAKRLGMKRPVLWLNPHAAVHMVGRMGECGVIYDITDDWIALTQSDAVRRLTIKQDEALCGRADAVIVCSQKLADLKKDLAQNLHLIPNGVDADHYKCVLNGEGDLPEITRNWVHPVFGYTGTIHSDRVDIDLLEATALALPVGSMALVGPSHLNAQDRGRLEATGRVCLTGSVPYAEIPEVMRAFDVCITPHRVTPFTESLNPIKLWEYLAAGKPIVSTDVAGFRDYPQYVQIARDSPGFLHALMAARDEDPALPERRQEEARRHSWHARVDAILDVVEEAVANHSRKAAQS